MCTFIGEGCTDNPADGEANYPHSMLGGMTALITAPFAHPPASGIYWATDSLQRAGFIPQSYAAEGIGFGALRPFLGAWKVFRDFAYIALVIVLITIGFLIMFRTKIDQQTVIGIENALPRIVITLLFITFSFPIAGFMIDLMYLIIALAVGQFAHFNIGDLKVTDQARLINKYAGAGFFTTWPIGYPFFEMGQSLLNILPTSINRIVRTTLSFYLSVWGADWLLSKTALEPIASMFKDTGAGVEAQALTFGGGGTAFLGNLGKNPILLGLSILFFTVLYNYAVPFVISLIVALTVIFVMFRIFFMLMASYIKILLYVIFAPLYLLLGAVPGKKFITSWFKNLAAEILTFPTVVVCALTAYFMTTVALNNSDKIWTPPFLYGLDTKAFATLVGVGIYFLTPDFVKLVKEKLGIKPTGLSIGPGLFFSAAGATTGSAWRQFSHYGIYAQHYAQMLPKSISSKLQDIPILKNVLKHGDEDPHKNPPPPDF